MNTRSRMASFGVARLALWGGGMPLLFLLAIIVFGTGQSAFLSHNNFLNIVVQASYLILIAQGQALVIITGGFDLSVGAVVSLASVLAGMALTAGFGSDAGHLVLALCVAVGCGGVVGLINGYLVGFQKLSPLIATLGTMTAIQGAALLLTSGLPISNLPDWFTSTFALNTIGGIPNQVLIVAVLVLLIYVLIRQTRYGRHLYAVGGNERAAFVAGVPVKRTVCFAYILAGILAGGAGFLLTAYVGSGEPNLGGAFPLMSIAAAVLGGVSLKGGVGDGLGAMIGAIFIVVITNGMALIGAGTYETNIVLGAALIFAALLDAIRQRLGNRR